MELAPETSARQLFTSAMRIGRDHIASTVYTIAFAYAGAALPVLILVMLYERPLGDALTSAELSEEVIRTLVGSVGLVLAIPVTTLIAVLVVKATGMTATSVGPARIRAIGLRNTVRPGAVTAPDAATGGVTADDAGQRPEIDAVAPAGAFEPEPAGRRGRRAAARD